MARSLALALQAVTAAAVPVPLLLFLLPCLRLSLPVVARSCACRFLSCPAEETEKVTLISQADVVNRRRMIRRSCSSGYGSAGSHPAHRDPSQTMLFSSSPAPSNKTAPSWWRVNGYSSGLCLRVES